MAGGIWIMSMSRVAIVTGGSRGIGAAIASTLRREGFTVIATSSKAKVVDATWQCDVRDESAVKELVESVIKQYGRIDVLVNNAGIASTKDMDISEWTNIIDTNLTGTFLMCKHVLPHMVVNGGRVINIGSVAGISRSKTASVAYTCSKYGITGLTKQLAPEYARYGITINCLCPSQTETEMLLDNVSPSMRSELADKNPSGRLADPWEIAEVVLFLTSSAAEYINGTTIPITGGIV
jgi:NAD(P)-dependent dehydrogenase (short-subunit alcohol dehydrogenase family)